MGRVRKPLQGVGNIVRFNWHFYASAVAAVLVAACLAVLVSPPLRVLIYLLLVLVAIPTMVSLVVSWYVYDASGLYQLDWLSANPPGGQLVNIHAGFDETSALLANRYGNSCLTVLDFYDPAVHTEVSIRRARSAYPPYPGTQRVNTSHLPLPDGSARQIFVFMAAHEIRDANQRVAFFQELHRILAPGGEVVVVEHLRDAANFAAYTVGFLHFYSRREWRRVFHAAHFAVKQEQKMTPFVSAFTLTSSGNTS